MPRFEREQSEYIEKVVYLNRVSKTVKGGRVMKFSALVVVGDGKGKVGIGMGKATEVPEAIKKAEQAARRNMRAISLNGTSIPHEAMGKFSCSKVLLRPAPEGRGVIAGGSVRAVLELCGINKKFKLGLKNPTIDEVQAWIGEQPAAE